MVDTQWQNTIPDVLTSLSANPNLASIILFAIQHIYRYTTFAFVLALHEELLINSVYISLMNAILTG